jgi:hypothetical protein
MCISLYCLQTKIQNKIEMFFFNPPKQKTTMTTTNTNTTYRISFTKGLSNKMTIFANAHQQTSSKQFRQEWQTWINTEEIQQHVSETIEKNPTYNINTLYDKIYESMRYHRRKTAIANTQTPPPPPPHTDFDTSTNNTPQPPPPPRKKTTFSQTFIKIITSHIQQNYQEKPEKAYAKFIETHLQDILQEKQYLLYKYNKILYDLDHEHTSIHYNKFKRNYKNAFQQYKKQIQTQQITL